MKTTIDIADDLLARAKLVAQKEGVTLKQLAEQGLRSELERRSHSPTVKIEPYVVSGKGPPPDLSWEKMRDLIYDNEERSVPR